MNQPIVLAVAGHDPSGGAGIQADIEAINACGGRAVTALTCTTVQDTSHVYRVVASEPALLREQIERLFDDLPIAAVKLGLLGSPDIATEIVRQLQLHPGLPVVFDPVLASGAGAELAGPELLVIMRRQLLPLTWLLTPNSLEARAIAACDTVDSCAERLIGYGCRAVLITGTHEPGSQVVNRLYRPGHPPRSSNWQRLPGSYHGSGCTLAAAAATFIAHRRSTAAAVDLALAYTWKSLQRGNRPGKGQALPNRLFERNVDAPTDERAR